MKLSEQLASLRADRAKAVHVMELVYGIAEKNQRSFTDEEQQQFDTAKAVIEKIDRDLGNLETLERELGRTAKPIIPGSGGILLPAPSLRELIRSSGLIDALKRSGERWTGEGIVKALIGGTGGAPALAWNVSNLPAVAASFGSAPLAGSIAYIIQVDGGTVLYNRVTISAGAAAKQAPEGTAKAHVQLAGDPHSLPVNTYASWEKVSTQCLADVEQLLAVIETLLRGSVNDAISADIYATAIAAGNSTAFVPVAGEIAQDAVLRAASQIAATGASSVAVALNPTDYVAMATKKADTAGIYMGTPPVPMPPVIQSAAIPAGQLLASATDGTGLCFAMRETLMLTIGLDLDDFTKNLRTALAEARGVPLVRAPARVVHGPLTSGTTMAAANARHR